MLDAGIRSEIPEKDHIAMFFGYRLRASLASDADVDERYT